MVRQPLSISVFLVPVYYPSRIARIATSTYIYHVHKSRYRCHLRATPFAAGSKLSNRSLDVRLCERFDLVWGEYLQPIAIGMMTLSRTSILYWGKAFLKVPTTSPWGCLSWCTPSIHRSLSPSTGVTQLSMYCCSACTCVA